MTALDFNTATPLDITVLIIFGIVSIVTLLGNGFIIVVNSHSWLQRKKLVPCDFLLTCLSISRFWMQCLSLSGQYIYTSSPVYYMCWFELNGFGLAWIYFNIASLSGTTCLIVFYCVKVTTFVHPFFLWLKSRIDRLVPIMVLMPVIAFALFSIPIVNIFWRTNILCSLIRNLTVNTSHIEVLEEFPLLVLQPLQFSFCAINFCICLTASILLLVSLWRHTRNLTKSGIHTKDLGSQAHIKVIKQLVFFLFFYILYFVALIITVGNILKFGKVERLITDTVLSVYSSAHSIILIWTNPKLKGVCCMHSSQRRKTFIKPLSGK